jgi:hypothetical protein
MRRLKAAAEPHRPVYLFDRAEPLSSGQVVPVDLELLEPIQEERIHEQRLGLVRRLSMMRIMARRTKAATVLA